MDLVLSNGWVRQLTKLGRSYLHVIGFGITGQLHQKSVFKVPHMKGCYCALADKSSRRERKKVAATRLQCIAVHF